MFGSKLRSWMENHIVRPRKKSSKNNKNALSKAVPAVSSHTAIGTATPTEQKKSSCSGYNVYHHSSNGVALGRNKSPTTASNHHGSMAGSSSSTTGGCSSVLSSPARRREVSPIQSHTPSRYGWQSPDHDVVTSPKSDNYLQASPQTMSSLPRTQDAYKPSQFSSSEASNPNATATKKQPPAQQQRQHLKEPSHTVDCSSSSMSSLSWSTGSKEPIQIKVHRANEQLNEVNDDGNTVHYEEIFSILRNPVQLASPSGQQMHREMPRPKSDQLAHLLPGRVPHFDNDMRQLNDNSKHYGKLLPSRITHANPHAHVQLHGTMGSAENLLPPNGARNAQMLNAHRTSYPLDGGVDAPMSRYKHNSMPAAVQGTCGGAATGSSVGMGAVAPVHHSLSSPESAYSSYSDGTSPGTSGTGASLCQYTPPEYYINMRTGVHYFPKNANSLAIESHRYKISLNKIEEMSPIDPLPKTSFNGMTEGMSAPGNQVFLKTTTTSHHNEQSLMSYYPSTRPPLGTIEPHSPQFQMRQNNNDNNNSMLTPNLLDFEYKLHTSPSPRQRSRIRTNPWYCTTDASLPMAAAIQMHHTSSSEQSKSDANRSSITCSSSSDVPFDIDTTMVSSSCLDSSLLDNISQYQRAEGLATSLSIGNHKGSGYSCTLSEEETSSSTTEVENFKNTVKRRHHHHHPMHQHQNLYSKIASKLRHHQTQMHQDSNNGMVNGDSNSHTVSHDVPQSDDDATLNEMMGKFDESYVYEKETDILSSDSDPTDCPSDLDTGQDAGDECETDELLDIDFIDTSSMQEVHDRKNTARNAGNCSYYTNTNVKNANTTTNNDSNNYHINDNDKDNSRAMSPVVQPIMRRSYRKTTFTSGSGGGGTAATTGASVGTGASGNYRRKRFLKTRKKSTENKEQLNSPVRKSRETRSVGGTPICLRKRNASENKRYKTTPLPLSNRSSSLVFTDETRENYRMTVAESEKALIKADLEADVKYRQLILEAESILVSLKSSVQSIPRDTPMVSPRRINPLSNKRVEMLKNSEAVEPKRDMHKQQQQAEQELVASLHKRIEMLKYESSSAPNSPKLCRLSPRKTHLTNFIQQNISSDSLPRKSSLGNKVNQPSVNQAPVRKPASPLMMHRRQRSCSSRISSATAAKLQIDSDSESERQHKRCHNVKSESKQRKLHRASNSNGGKHLHHATDDYSSGSNSVENFASQMSAHGSSRDLRHFNHMGSTSVLVPPRPFNLISFDDAITYCPQSEPLKRKVYKNAFNFGHIKQGIDLESEIPKQALLSKINLMRRERCSQLNNAKMPKSFGMQFNYNESNDSNSVRNSTNCINKKQLILNTIADLKRNLEEQSVELNGLNDN